MAEAIIAAGGRAVITSARSADELKATEAAIAQKYGARRLSAVVADVTAPEQCERVVASTLATFGRLDALINNAGRGMRTVSETYTTNPIKFWEVQPKHWGLIFDTNVDGTFHMTRAAMPHFLARRWGRIVNISTSDMTMVRRGYSPYGPTKAA